MTSNVGASTIKRQTALGFGAMSEDEADFEGMKEKILEESKITRLREKEITLELDESARDLLVKKGYDPSYGARPMRRAVERYLEDPLAEALLRGDVKEGDTARVHHPEGAEELVFETTNGADGPESPAPDEAEV